MIGHLASVFDVQNSTLRYWIAAEAIGLKALNLPNEEARRAYWRAFEKRKEAFYPWATKRITAVFRAEMNAVVEGMRAGIDVNAVITSRNQNWSDALAAIHKRVGHTFAKLTWSELNPGKSANYETKAEDLWLMFLTEYIEDMVAEHVSQILQTTREAIQASILAGLTAGEGVYELTQRIKALYLDEIIPYRAEVVARTEAHSAASAASLAAARATEQQTGLKLKKQWLATPDNRTRDAHRFADGQEQELTEPYNVGGYSLMYPGDSSLGASADMVVNCRCVSTYFTVK
jgi:uncharacterized protein with gpF-like domain